jgi:peptide/nickel transport system permease protein
MSTLQETEKQPLSKNSDRVNEGKRFFRVFFSRGLVVIGMVIIIVFVFIAIFAPLLTPYNPLQPNLMLSLNAPSTEHWLGTDALGRDVLCRIFFGTRTSLLVGLSTVFLACSVGMTLGLIAGYYGGWTHNIIMRFIDALMTFPMILLALIIAALMGSGITNVIIALAVAMMPGYARLMCGQVLTVRENDYVQACRSMGAKSVRIMLRHIVPNCFPSLIVMITIMLGSVILAEAGLSFLGIGITPPTPAWGIMIDDGRKFLRDAPALSFAPGVAIMLVVFAFNMVGDGLRDAMDPRLRGTI